MKTILVTGASGFLGSHLVEAALEQGLEVYAGIRKTSSRQYLQDKRIKFFTVDFSRPEWMYSELESHGFDYIIHNAGVTTARSAEVYFKVNTQYTKEFVDNINRLNSKPEKLILISSAAAFGAAEHTKNGILDSEAVANPKTPYGQSKLQAEDYLREKSEVPYLIFRPAGIFGPRDTDIFLVFKNMKFRISPSLGFSEQRLGLIYVKDLANIIIKACLSNIQNKAYFASDGQAYSSTYFNQVVAEAMNVSPVKLAIPKFLVRSIAHLSDGFAKLTNTTTPLTVDKAKILLADSWECDISELEQDFKFKPAYDIKTATKETADWYRKHGWL